MQKQLTTNIIIWYNITKIREAKALIKGDKELWKISKQLEYYKHQDAI